MKGNEKEEEKPKEVVHVRARRGQATDSHSLAERVNLILTHTHTYIYIKFLII